MQIESDHNYRRANTGTASGMITGKEFPAPGVWFTPEVGEEIGGGGPYGPDRRYSYSNDPHVCDGTEKARLVGLGTPYDPAIWEVEEV